MVFASFKGMICKFMEITHSSHMKMVKKKKKSVHTTSFTKESQFHAWICDPLKSALSVDDTLPQKCFEWVKWAIRVTRFPFFRCRKYQSGDKSCSRCAAIHSCIALIAAVLSSRHDLNWDFFPQIILEESHVWTTDLSSQAPGTSQRTLTLLLHFIWLLQCLTTKHFWKVHLKRMKSQRRASA